MRCCNWVFVLELEIKMKTKLLRKRTFQIAKVITLFNAIINAKKHYASQKITLEMDVLDGQSWNPINSVPNLKQKQNFFEKKMFQIKVVRFEKTIMSYLDFESITHFRPNKKKINLIINNSSLNRITFIRNIFFKIHS